jgi:myo-inositol-1-phosphate synthase
MTKKIKTKNLEIEKPEGKLGVLLPGLGAVATTFIAGVLAIKKGLGKPFGSITQMQTIRLGKRTEKRAPLIKDFVPLADINDLVFGGWDIFKENCYQAAKRVRVLDENLLEKLKPELEEIKAMRGVFNKNYVRNLNGNYIKWGNRMEMAEKLIEDIRNFKKKNKCQRLVMIWTGSTEIYMKKHKVHSSLKNFEEGLKKDSKFISPSMIYAYAALKEGIPFANGSPNLCVDTPALVELSKITKTPIAGKDFKTGQTLLKTIIAPGLKARMLGIKGWFSTNILGDRDGEVLADPMSFKTKEKSKLGVLETILQPHLYPELYGKIEHLVRINYYPPRGDNKEAWDNIDIFGWLGYPMQIKINFLCIDSILAAPLVLDLALFLDLAKRAGLFGIQEWLSFYFKSPQVAPGLYPENDLFIQLTKLKNTLRWMMGEELITHLGREYYET